MSDLKWSENKGQGFKPGTVRLNDGNLKMLIVIASSSGNIEQLHQHLADIKKSMGNKSQLHIAINKLMNDIQLIEEVIEQQTLTQRKSSATLVLSQLLNMGADGEFSDYIAAEQAVMAIDLLFDFIGNKNDFDKDISQLFTLVDNDEKFNAGLFSTKLNEINKLMAR